MAGEGVEPEQDTPACPFCGGDVEEVLTGPDAGRFVCVASEGQRPVRLVVFNKLAWRA